ncbi:MAG: HK97 family phage prohead protease [Maricaulaceae bacterium]|jgi:HK97 family phage prohead protease
MEKRLLEAHLATKDRRLVGHVVRFNTPTKIGNFTEVVSRGAFKRALASAADIVALADHDATRPLARTKNGTLKLREDDVGLAFDITLNTETTLGRDVLALAERGDLSGMSFGFAVREERWSANRTERTLIDLDLIEISVISGGRPAYDGTTVQARAGFDGVTPEFMRRRITLLGLGVRDV